MPMWCSSSDTPRLPAGHSQPHHRIVRIPPGESVVLNSAERAPYLLLIEILNDDLDFDPAKRSNKEVLKKIVIKEDERKGASRDLISFNHSAASRHHKIMSDSVNGADVVPGDDMADISREPIVIIPTASSSATSLPHEEEEIDLVEQLYGADQSLRSRPIDLSESIVLPRAPKNKELDMAAWSRSSSIPPSPALEQGPAVLQLSSPLPVNPDSNRRSTPSLQVTPRVPDSPQHVNGNGRILSLDEYSERMRTAAIMLAQLNANLVREPITTVPASVTPASTPESPTQSGPLSWLPGSSWLASSADQSNTRGPIHPSLAGGSGDPNGVSASSVPTRMRLQHAEAAAIRDRIMKEMLALEEERMDRMRENREGEGMMRIGDLSNGMKTAEDEGIIRRELNKADPSAVVFSESWVAKKVHAFTIRPETKLTC